MFWAALPLLSTLVLYWLEVHWVLMAAIAVPSVVFSSGWGWSVWLHKGRSSSFLQLVVDAAWIGMVQCWISVALVRELGLGVGTDSGLFLIGGSALWLFSGLFLARNTVVVQPFPAREKHGIYAVLIALLFLCFWKGSDLTRPLDGYWYLHGAADDHQEKLALKPARNWETIEEIGWEEAGAVRLVPSSKNPDFIATDRVNGRITLLVRGPVGSSISVLGERNVVLSAMSEPLYNTSVGIEEGPVRRYLEKGVAGISIWADLQPGEYLGLDVVGDEVYLLPSSEAVWALHSTGKLRYTFHYQLLNQVENLVWAQEILVDRRFTWNQPPGWSPLLAASMALTVEDMQGAAALFFWVLMLIGLTNVRLCSVLSPQAEREAFYVPAAFMLVHALLMIEPGSFNFPDSLYTAALLAVALQVFKGTPSGFGFMGMLTQALRWPGTVVTLFFIIAYRLRMGVWGPAGKKGLLVLGGCVLFGVLCSVVAVFTGDAEDLLFILYFETFPEHWHGNYSPIDLLSRVPSFYGLWLMYSGGALLLIVPFLFGSSGQPERKSLHVILGATFAYSLLLATIDHHPSHYFLPLVALTAPCLVLSSSLLPTASGRKLLLYLGLLGVGIYLWNGVV
ncbi:MAG: hypothetical protein CMK59_02080 [Proteobacteria bacterium]|nr:hypothetical protein [Pseudomonadota bacterium]